MGANGIYGLSGSGLDIDSMVKVGMLSKQNTYDKMYQQETKNTWIKEAYVDVYNQVNSFKEAMSTFNKQSKMNAMQATSSNSSAVTAAANGSAAAMNHKVKVTSVASNAYMLTETAVARNNADETAAASYKLSDVAFAAINETVLDSEGKTQYNLCRSVKSLADIADKSIDYGGGSYKNAVVNAKGEVDLYDADGKLAKTVTKDDFKKDATVKYNDGGSEVNAQHITIGKDGGISCGVYEKVKGDAVALSFKVSDGTNESEISYTFDDLFNDEKTLYDLATDISDSGVNITAKYDATTDALSLYNKSGGEANKIEFSLQTGSAAEAAATLLNNLDLKASDGKELSALKDSAGNKVAGFAAGTTVGTKGSNGEVMIDGKTYSNLDNNSLTVAGVTYTFNNETAGEYTNISVSQDTDSIVDNVKSFVEEYNKLLESLQAKYNETAYSDYKPLTKNQESQMTESQINAWNEKAKSGMLYHDSTLRELISSLREAVAAQVDSVDSVKTDGTSISYNSASALGITSSNNKGHLTLDEDKLRNALSTDSDCVYQVFGKLEYAKDKFGKETANVDSKNSGIANRLYFLVAPEAMNKIKDYAGTSTETDDNSYLGNLITNMLTKMSSFKTQMSAYETLLYNKYDKMEVALSKLGTQLSYITG